MIQSAKHLWKDCRGTAVEIMLFGLIFLLMLLVMLAMELGGVYQRYYNVDTILQRACNSALEANLVDDMRADHILYLDTVGAESDFRSYVAADFSSDYTVVITDFDATEKPPAIIATCSVTMPSLFAQSFMPEITFDYEVHTTNYELDDDYEIP